MKSNLIAISAFCCFAAWYGLPTHAARERTRTFQTDYFRMEVNARGYIVGMYNRTRPDLPNFSPADRPSPLMALYAGAPRRCYLYPQRAEFNGNRCRLHYEGGAVATVRLEEKDKYIKLTLESLQGREGISAIQWGNYYTTISGLLGEIIGVARDTTAAVNYAIGALALTDNTIGGEARYTSDTGWGGYIVHTPDSRRFPLPPELHEGQQFTLGGNGISDVAFYNRKEPYFRMLYGATAGVDPGTGRINIRYQSRDRRRGDLIYSPEGVPIQSNNEPNHLQRQDVAGVDYIGSAIALWGSPDSTALMDVIQDIVRAEGLPYPTFQGRWIKDPTAYMPDLLTYGREYDSIPSYARQMGLKVISAYDQGFIYPNRADSGYIDGRGSQMKRPFKMGQRQLSHSEFARELARQGLCFGRTAVTTSLAPGTADCSPTPSDSICIQHRRHLTVALSATDTLIYIDDPTYLNEIACWEGHCEELNMVRIGKELIHYLGVSQQPPYRLLHVTRGYWNTQPAAHPAGAAVDKLQVTVGWGYQGLVPNLELQDAIGRYYADMALHTGIRYYDFDGQEFLFHSGFGTYSVKRFFRQMFSRARALGLPDIRFTGATLSEGSWHYQSIWNVGAGLNLYDVERREWGSTTSQGKDLRDVTYANYYPCSFGGNFPITATSTAEQYEHIEAIAVGFGATYSLKVSQADVEKCPQKYQIFRVIRTWEEARRADAFPTHVRKLLQDPTFSWHLQELPDGNGWTLEQTENGRTLRTFRLKPRR